MQTHKKIRHLIHILFRRRQILVFTQQFFDVRNQLVASDDLIFDLFRRLLQVDDCFRISKHNHGFVEFTE